MRQLVIDELRRNEVEKIHGFLTEHASPGPFEGVYWLTVPQDLLGRAQLGHEECGPFYLAIEVGDDFCAFELLVRAKCNLHCSCIAYATPAQRGFLLSFADRLLESENIGS